MNEPNKTDYDNAKAFTQNLLNEIETALICEIEKIEGKVPSKKQMSKHGVQRFDKKTGETYYLWKGNLIVTVKPNQLEDGRRGTMLVINKMAETKEKE